MHSHISQINISSFVLFILVFRKIYSNIESQYYVYTFLKRPCCLYMSSQGTSRLTERDPK